jgi:uncharacterized RDD family membrane protein YckC
MNTMPAKAKETQNYSSFFRRWGAVFLDGLVLIIPGIILGKMFPFVGGVFLWLLYAPFLESSALRATVGKKLLGIQVVDLQGNTITFRAAMIRSLMKLVSCVFAFLPYLLALFTDRKQALHDIVAETVVVYGTNDVSAVDAWVNSFQSVFRVPTDAAKRSDSLSALERLQALHERGALSKEEFEAEKRKILGA